MFGNRSERSAEFGKGSSGPFTITAWPIRAVCPDRPSDHDKVPAAPPGGMPAVLASTALAAGDFELRRRGHTQYVRDFLQLSNFKICRVQAL